MCRRKRHGRNWRLHSVLWWASLIVAAGCPTAIAVLVSMRMHMRPSFGLVAVSHLQHDGCWTFWACALRMQAKLRTGLRNLDSASSLALSFELEHPIHIPPQVCP